MRRATDRQKGFTLIELLVVIIIIGILAAIAIPAFLNQRTKGYDAAAKSDLKNAAAAMETYYAENFTYPTTAVQHREGGFTPSKDVTIRIVYNNGADSGYVIFAKHAQSDQRWIASSYSGGAPVATDLPSNDLPASGGVRTTLKIPSSLLNTNGYTRTG